MDIDRFIATNQETWTRLEELSSRAGRGIRQISAAELDELVMLYQRTSGHLSSARTQFNDAALNARLSRLLGAARGVVYRRSDNPVRAVGRFFSETFPAAVWHSRRFVAVAAFLLLAPALAMGIWLANDSAALRNSIDPIDARALAANEFADYYSSDAAGAFQAKITTNNIQVSVLAFGSGVLLGIPTILLLASNGANIGVSAAVMQHYGKGTEFWGLITPHGLLEITAITIAGAAGLRLGWAIVSPGDRTRSAALADEGMRCVPVVAGIALCFVTAGFIEAWITPSGLPTAARVGIGVVVEAAFILYIAGMGRAAESRGLTGRLGETPRTWEDEAADRASHVARRGALSTRLRVVPQPSR